MGKTYGPSSNLMSGLLRGTVFIGICLAAFFARQTANAGKVDDIAALIAGNTIPLPTVHPRRRKAKISTVPRSKATIAATNTGLLIAPPPLPTHNPLRRLKQKGSLALQVVTTLHIPPVPTRGGLISDRIKALAPVLNVNISTRDMALLKKSIEYNLKGRSESALASKNKISDPTVRKLAHWYYLRKASDISTPMTIEHFRVKNPDWPSRSLLRRRTEQALLKTKASPKIIKTLYGKNAPSSGIGKYLLALAYKRSGQKTKALKLARAAWHTHVLGKKIEDDLIKEFGDRLAHSDHRRRADHFLYKDNRRHLPTIRRVKKYLTKSEEEKINLRMEVVKRRLNAADKQYKEMGTKALSDSGLLFNRIQLLRRKEKFVHSRKLLSKAPIDVKGMVEPDEWWIERRLQTRYALRQNKPLEAYKIASRHGKISRKNQCEAEFLAGWIALTRLNRVKAATRHFTKERKAARSRTEIAKAEYWLGRSKLRQRDTIAALAHFAASAKYFRTYYGQLALQSVERHGRIDKITAPAPSQRDLERFVARDAVRALVIAHKAQFTGLIPLFFNQLAWRLKSPGEMTLLAELASQIHSRRGSVITGKIGIHRGFKLDRYAYPVNALPHFDQLTDKVDTALVLALARQESEFNAKAKSPVGARGMMQIMPGTAKAIARQHKVRYSRQKLISDPSYNIALGVAHLHDLIKKYNGSYILPLVAYNAGPGRVRDWIVSFGDPRNPKVDTINWIESIPFSETRRYVQRIMSSVQIFRARLKGTKGQVRLVQDINRGQPNEPKKAAQLPVVNINFTDR